MRYRRTRHYSRERKLPRITGRDTLSLTNSIVDRQLNLVQCTRPMDRYIIPIVCPRNGRANVGRAKLILTFVSGHVPRIEEIVGIVRIVDDRQ